MAKLPWNESNIKESLKDLGEDIRKCDIEYDTDTERFNGVCEGKEFKYKVSGYAPDKVVGGKLIIETIKEKVGR